MRFREWWENLSYWKKGIFIGALIGILKLPFFMLLGEQLPIFVHYIASKIPDEFICNLLDIGSGEPCGFFVFIYGWLYNPLFYGLIGGLIGFIYGKLKK